MTEYGSNLLVSEEELIRIRGRQRAFVISQLRENGYISRNAAISNYITRLGAIVFDLRKSGWELKGKYVKKNTESKFKTMGDYVYEVVTDPKDL